MSYVMQASEEHMTMLDHGLQVWVVCDLTLSVNSTHLFVFSFDLQVVEVMFTRPNDADEDFNMISKRGKSSSKAASAGRAPATAAKKSSTSIYNIVKNGAEEPLLKEMRKAVIEEVQDDDEDYIPDL